MPMYDWECKHCGETAITIYSVENRDIPPTDNDPPCSASPLGHEWVRVVKAAPALRAGPNWGGGKGSW